MIEPCQAYPFLDDEEFMLLVQRLWEAKQRGDFWKSDQISLHLMPEDDRVNYIEYSAKNSRREKVG